MNGNDRSIVGFVMAAHAMVHAYELSVPILMTIWLLEFSVTAAVLGGVVAIGYGLFGVGALPGGILVDRYGSRTLITGCLIGMAGGFGLLSLSSNVAFVAVALGVWGVAASVYHPAGLALISNGVRERGSAFAYHGMAGNVGIAFGPLATAVLLLAFDWRIVTALLAVPALIAAVAGTLIEFDETAAVEFADGGRDQHARERSLSSLVTETRALFTVGFLTVFLIVMLDGLYYRGMLTFLPDLLGGFLATSVGDVRLGVFDADSPLAEEFDLAKYIYVGLLIVGIAGQYVGGRLIDRVETEWGLVGMLIVLVLVALLFVPAASAGLPTLLGVTALLGLALFAMQPLTQATIAKYSPPETRGLSFGYTYLAIFGIGSLGAAIAGTALTYASVSTMFLVLAVFPVVAFALALSLVFRLRR